MASVSLDEAARVAEPHDVGVIAGLVREALDAIAEQRGGELWTLRHSRSLPADTSVADAIGDDDHLVVVGTLDESVVGYLMARVEVLPDKSVLAVIDDLFVLPDGRQVGVGGEMMSLAMQWARDRDCRGIDAAALPGDRHTKNFFESNGLVARAILVHHALTDPAPDA